MASGVVADHNAVGRCLLPNGGWWMGISGSKHLSFV